MPSPPPPRSRSRSLRPARSRPRGASAPRAILALGLAGALALAGAATLDFGDPAAVVHARLERAARAEVELARLELERRLRGAEPCAAPLGEVLRAPARVAPNGSGADATAAAAEERAPSEPSALDTLLDAALAAGARGATERALELVLEALAAQAAAQPARAAEAHLRALAWAHELGLEARAAEQRAALFALPAGLSREGIPYRLLAALAGPAEPAALETVQAELARGALRLPAPRDRIALDAERGLRFAGDPLLAALEERAAARAPAATLDWAAAFERPERCARAAEAWLPADLALAADLWTLFAAPSAGRASPGADAALVCGARREAGGGLTLFATTRAALAAALREGAAAPAEGTAPADGLAVHIAPPAELAGEDWLLGPVELGDTGLAMAVAPQSLDRELAREKRRIALVRGGLVGLAALVALAAGLAARALARERRLAELRSTFVAGVSHDLRTPLASILLLVENLERGRVVGEASRAKYHGALRQEADRLRRMVEDLLDASRVDRGEVARVEPAPTDMAAFLGELERALAERAELAGAALRVTREALPAELEIDADAVRRAVWNLFENALRHGKSADGRTAVEIRVCARAGALEFTVADAGPGIPARHREAIFAPFERLGAPGVPGGLAGDAGTGLGLAIVRAIARAHGGDARALDDAAGGGARFHFSVRAQAERGTGA